MESKIEKQTESCKADTPLHDKIRKGGAIVNRMTSEIGVVGNIADGCAAVPVRRTAEGTLCDEEVERLPSGRIGREKRATTPVERAPPAVGHAPLPSAEE